MFNLKDMLSRDLAVNLAIGVGVTVLAPIVLPALFRLAKPVLKAAIMGGVFVYHKGVETVSELTEVVEDIVAEAQAEMQGPSEAVIAPAAPAAPSADVTAPGT